MFEIFAVFLVPQKRVLINAIINTVNGSTFPEFLRAVLTMASVSIVHDVLRIVMSLLLRLVSFEFAVFMSPLIGGLSLFTEGSSMSIEVEVRSLIALFIVVFFGPRVFIFVVGILVSLDDVSLLVSFLFFLLEVVLGFKLKKISEANIHTNSDITFLVVVLAPMVSFLIFGQLLATSFSRIKT